MAGMRRADEQTSASEPHSGLQGEGGLGSHQGRKNTFGIGAVVRCACQPDYAVEEPAFGRRSWGLRKRGEGRGRDGYCGPQDPPRQDRRADTGERFFRRRAHQGGTAERKAMIDPEHDLPIKQQAEVLGISRSTVYYEPRPISDEDLWLMRRLDELHLNYPFAGSRMLRGLLWQQGLEVGRRHIKTLMKRMGIEAIYRKPNTSKPAPGHKIYPYLLRDLAVTRPNQAWAMDITYVPMEHGFVYLAAVVDWFSRRVLAWRLSITMEASFCIEAVEEALSKNEKPEIFNTDQGSQFTSDDFTGLLRKNGIDISMDGRGRWRDNVFVERVWKSIKYEEVYLHAYETVKEARTSIGKYLEFYNSIRPHSSLDGFTPDQVYFNRLPEFMAA